MKAKARSAKPGYKIKASASKSPRELITEAMRDSKAASNASPLSNGTESGGQKSFGNGEIPRPVFSEPKTELEQAIHRYVELFDFAPIAYVSFDRSGRIEEINFAATKLFGRSRNSLVGCPLSVYVHHGDTHLFLNHLLRCRCSDQQVETELRLRNADGETIYGYLSSVPTTSSRKDGTLLFQTAIVDLTEQRRSAEAIRKSEERATGDLQAMTLINEVGNCCVDPRKTREQVLARALEAAVAITAADKGNIQLYDPESGVLNVAAHLGFPRSFLNFFESVSYDEAAACGAALRARQRVVVDDVAKSHIFAGKPSREVLLRAGVRAVQSTPLLSSGRNILGMISTHFGKPHHPEERQLRLIDLLARHLADYLERTRAESLLFESEQRYRTLFNLVPTAVYTCDADGRILEFNRHAAKLWGREARKNDPREKYSGAFKLFYSDGRPMLDRDTPMARTLRGENVPLVERELKIERQDGTCRHVASNPTALRGSKGNIIGAINCLYDITDLKKAESELREKKGELDLIVTETPFMLTRCSKDLRYRYVSDAYAKMVGLPPEKIAGQPMNKIMGKAGFEAIRPHVERVLSGKRVDYEMMVPFKSANHFLHATYVPERNERNQVIGWIASLVDITERAKAEKALAEAARQQSALYHFVRRRHDAKSLEEIYASAIQAILTTLPCPRASILLFDNDGVMRFVASDGISARYRKKVEGHSPWKPTAKKPKPICIPNIKEAKMPASLKATILAEGIQAASFIPLIAEGKLIGKFMTYYDSPHICNEEEVTMALNIAGQLALAIERKKAEAALVESEKIHRAFFSQTDVGMTRSDNKGRLVAVNKKLCQIIGFDEAELIGRKIDDLTLKQYRKETKRLFRELVEQGKPYHIEKQYARKDGSDVWVSVTASPIRDSQGQTQAAVAVVRDISQRKEVQQELEKANRLLEDRVRERTQDLLASNQRLQAEARKRKQVEGEILGISEREQRRIGQELHDSVCQHLTAIAFMTRSVAMRLKTHRVVDVGDLDKIADLINEGVTETRTIARGLHPVEMNPDGLAAALQTLLHRRSQIPYRLEIDDDVTIPDATVALHLYRIASEAVINANKHARAREVTVRMRSSASQIELSVSDDGVGLRKKLDGGQGMGFHVMDYRARSIGAHLEITSIKPHGTRVACYLPRR